MKKTAGLLFLLTGLLLSAPCALFAQQNEQWRAWNQPVEPFQIIGNIYYVGATEIGAYLITTPDGHLLLDGGFPETAAIIQESVKKLGFEMADVEILLNSHAHFDHAGGLAALKEISGAQLFVSEPDADLIERGGKGDFLLADSAQFPPVQVDRRLADGETVQLGGVTMTAHLTAGHTQGCTTWTMEVQSEGETYDVVWVCSVSVLDGVQLVEAPSYPGIADDFARTFETLQALPVDVFLAGHGSFFGLLDKIEARAANPAVNPFIDPDRYHGYVERGERIFRERLAEQTELRSDVFPWNAPDARSDHKQRFILGGPTTTLAHLEVHAVTLAPGEAMTNQQHPDLEELLLIKAGTLEVTQNETVQVMGPNSVAVTLPGDTFGYANIGEVPVTFFVYQYRSKAPINLTRGQEAGGSFMVDWEAVEFVPSDIGGRRQNFDRATAMFERFEMHASTLNEALTNHAAHTHGAEEFVVMIEGNVEMLLGEEYKQAAPGDIIFIQSEIPHSLRNIGTGRTEYFAFQWE